MTYSKFYKWVLFDAGNFLMPSETSSLYLFIVEYSNFLAMYMIDIYDACKQNFHHYQRQPMVDIFHRCLDGLILFLEGT